MKKLLLCLFSVTTLLMLTACGGESISFKVITPNGSPALSQAYFQSTKPSLGDNVSYSVDVVNGTDPLVAAFNGTYEFIFAPTNLGVKMYNMNQKYQFLGTVVWGNLYFATVTDSEFNLEYLNDKDIILFGENTVPGIVASEVLKKKNCNVSYLTSTAETQAELISDNSKIVLIAEPSLSALKTKLAQQNITNVKTINLTTVWESLTGLRGIPQAGVFVNKEFASKNKDIVKSYIKALEESCNRANDDTDSVAAMAVELEYGFPLPVLKGSLKNSNIKFVNSKDSKEALEDFLQRIIESSNGNLIGNKLPDSDFYFE